MDEARPTEYAIEVEDLSRTFGVRKAIDGVSFKLPKRAFLSVFGPNGAGKTTLLKILSTLAPPTKGDVKVLGYDLVKDAVKLRENIGFISHNPLLYMDLTAEENLMFFAELYCIPNPKERVRELLFAVELEHRRLDLVSTFSRGMVQRLSIARALLHDPELLFLDEPYSGLDPHAVDILDSLIDAVRSEHTFVMISHDLQKGLEHCTHALILAKGKVILFDEKANLAPEEFEKTYKDTVGLGVS